MISPVIFARDPGDFCWGPAPVDPTLVMTGPAIALNSLASRLTLGQFLARNKLKYTTQDTEGWKLTQAQWQTAFSPTVQPDVAEAC